MIKCKHCGRKGETKPIGFYWFYPLVCSNESCIKEEQAKWRPKEFKKPVQEIVVQARKF